MENNNKSIFTKIYDSFLEDGIAWKILTFLVFTIINFLCFQMANHEVFWYDEAYTVGMIQRDFADIISITANDVHSPFYYFVLKVFYMTIGMKSLVSIKVFTWLFFDAYLILGSYICRKHFNRKVEFFWLLLSCFIPSMIIQSTTARMYTFALFWVTLASYLAYNLYQKESKGKWILFTISSVIATYIHTFSMIEMVVVYGLFLVIALMKKKCKKGRNVLISGIVVSVSYLPWLFSLFHQFSRWAGWESGWNNTIESISLMSFVDYAAEWFSSRENPNFNAVFFGIFLMVLALIFTVKYVVETKDFLPVLGVIVAVITFAIAMLVSIFIVPCFLGRYLFPVFGGIWLCAAVGISKIKIPYVQMVLVVSVMVLGIMAYQEEMRLEDETGLEIYKSHIENEWVEGDVIMTDTYFHQMMSIYYPEKQYMQYGGIPSCMPFANFESFKSWEQLESADTVWYIAFDSMRSGYISDMYTLEETWSIPFSYYGDLKLEKWEKISK